MSEQSLGMLLAAPVCTRIDVSDNMSGFGGAHGGLLLALMTSSMSQQVPGLTLRSVTGQYLRPIRGETAVQARVIRRGRIMSATEATAGPGDDMHLRASAIWSVKQQPQARVFAPSAPPASPPEELPVFAIPPGIVPFGQHIEVRPVGPARPFSGGPIPELTAWIRIVCDHQPPDILRVITLMDALPASYAAVMSHPRAVPTAELTVRPGVGLADVSSPWLLVDARTTTSSADGWIEEQIHAWGPDGSHLASAQQLRILLA